MLYGVILILHRKQRERRHGIKYLHQGCMYVRNRLFAMGKRREIIKFLALALRDSILFLLAILGLFFIFAGVFAIGLEFPLYWPIIAFGIALFLTALVLNKD